VTTRTRPDLVIKILEILINLPEGQAPEIEDAQRVDQNLPSIIAQLAALEIVYVGDITKIPEPWFLPIAKYCAYELRALFGATGDFAAELRNGSDEGVMQLKIATRGRPTFEPLKTLSF
jgi:hypothetical protein